MSDFKNMAYRQLGNTIRELRVSKKITQAELASKLGHETSQFVSFMERGISKVPAKTLGQISAILGISDHKMQAIVRSIAKGYHDDFMAEVKEGRKAK